MELTNEPTSPARADHHPMATCHGCGRSVPLIPAEDPAVKIEHPWRYAHHLPSLELLRGFPGLCKVAGHVVPEHVWKAAIWEEDARQAPQPAARPSPSTPTAVSMADFY